MKPNLLLFTALILISAMLFLNLPEDVPQVPGEATHVQQLPRQNDDVSPKDVSAELQRMRSDYSLLLQEMALLRARMEQTQTAPAENRRAGMASTTEGEDNSAPGVTIYLDTSKIPPAGSRGREWTAVGVHDAGRAADGSKQAVLSISKINRPDGGQQEEPVRAMPVSRWQ